MQRDLEGADHVEYSIKLEQCWKLHQGSKALLRTCPNEKNRLDSYLRSHELDEALPPILRTNTKTTRNVQNDFESITIDYYLLNYLQQ